MAIKERLYIRLMDVEITYLYEKLDNENYMKVPKGLKISKISVH